VSIIWFKKLIREHDNPEDAFALLAHRVVKVYCRIQGFLVLSIKASILQVKLK